MTMIPLAFRNDGFTAYFREPTMTRETLETEYIDIVKNTNVAYLGWGAGPSSVFCYDTQVGDLFAYDVSDEQWKIFRKGDRWVHDNLRRLIASGADPLSVAVERGHQIGKRVYCRYQMNHEYGPASEDNFLWVGFVGSFNKDHPEYRIPGTTHLDFKHEAVRTFKLRIIEEIAERGVDAVMIDYTVYPPHFERPDRDLMTDFVRRARATLEAVGRRQSRTIELIVELPYRGSEEMGLDWRRWMRERLVDVIVPTRMRSGETFDVRIDEFVRLGRETGCRVWGFIWFSLGFASTDPMPQDEKTGVRRYGKPKTKGMYFAQAHLFHTAGVEAIELVGGSGREWQGREWYDQLADPETVRFADKHYTADAKLYVPTGFVLPDSQPYVAEAVVTIRVADNVSAALHEGHTVRAWLLIYSRRLNAGERVHVSVNGRGSVSFTGNDEPENGDAPVNWRTERPGWMEDADGTFISEPDWWKRGEHRLELDAQWLRSGENVFRMTYCAESADAPDYETSFIDLIIEYDL